jgi:hypothetical protein
LKSELSKPRGDLLLPVSFGEVTSSDLSGGASSTVGASVAFKNLSIDRVGLIVGASVVSQIGTPSSIILENKERVERRRMSGLPKNNVRKNMCAYIITHSGG